MLKQVIGAMLQEAESKLRQGDSSYWEGSYNALRAVLVLIDVEDEVTDL